MIKCIDRKLERVILTYKELLGTWEENVKDFSEGETVTGIAREIEKSKNVDNSKWDFHWDGRGDYEEARRVFYGDFS